MTAARQYYSTGRCMAVGWLIVIALLGLVAAVNADAAQPTGRKARQSSHSTRKLQVFERDPAEAAKVREFAAAVKRVYGGSAPTAPGLNARVYDLEGNDFQLFLGGLPDQGYTPPAPLPAWSAVGEKQEVASTSPLCGREDQRGTVRIHITCPDWPRMRIATGATMFPDQKGVQVFVRSSDPATVAFEVTIHYRQAGDVVTKTAFTAVDPKYDSGAGWLIGESELLSVDVSELRRSASVTLP